MGTVTASQHTASEVARQFLRQARPQPLRVPGVKCGAYLLVTDPDGSSWVVAPRRSAADEHGRSELLREPEPSWCFAEAFAPMARHAGAIGVRVLDRSTHLVYELGLDEFSRLAVPYQSAGFERQLRVPLRLWRVRLEEGPARITTAGAQLSLFAEAAP